MNLTVSVVLNPLERSKVVLDSSVCSPPLWTYSQLGLPWLELQGLKLHGQAHVPRDLQLALKERSLRVHFSGHQGQQVCV